MALRARRQHTELSEATRRALLDSARKLFTEYGYAGASLDDIVAAAGVTKGALYHHYKGKQELFEAVVEERDREATEEIRASIAADPEPTLETAVRALGEYLDLCVEPSYRRLVVQDGPAVMGYARWQELTERHGLGVVLELVTNLVERGEVKPLPAMMLARLFYGAMTAGGTAIAMASDTVQAREEVAVCFRAVIDGLRASHGDRGNRQRGVGGEVERRR